MPVAPVFSSTSAEIAWMLNGTSRTDSERRVAVTMTSSTVCSGFPALPSSPEPASRAAAGLARTSSDAAEPAPIAAARARMRRYLVIIRYPPFGVRAVTHVPATPCVIYLFQIHIQCQINNISGPDERPEMAQLRPDTRYSVKDPSLAN